MSIKTTSPLIETANFKNTPPQTKPETNVIQKDTPTNFDLSDLHEAAKKIEENSNQIIKSEATIDQKSIAKNSNTKNLGLVEKFLDDNWGVRTFFALGNEIAESFYDLAEHLLPKPVAKALYAGFWSLAVVATGGRVVANANHAKKEDKFKAAGKLLMHDGISAIAAPTIVAKTMNFIQNKLYEPLPLPATLKHLVKSVISILTCKFTIHQLDPIAMKLSGKTFNYTNDRHSEINKEGHKKHGEHNTSFASAA